jgi:hypothetical protein
VGRPAERSLGIPLSHLQTVFGPLLLEVGGGEHLCHDPGAVDGRVGVARPGDREADSVQKRARGGGAAHLAVFFRRLRSLSRSSELSVAMEREPMRSP